ncbi:hypothetical protein TSA6c_17185 [Azospirillum sp. TSA6c]|uniref:hypothetical protein n=1 Tax=Azospirillum sp. TSA6c TaxID=709813 RepID=UPI000D6179D4|nr:hypothetical protein [Azospirillum sp. TSA6c]PWC48163.1 hypothetical protein TSA6c_17185 [Azospirillum sp. TSA6c]
MGVRFLFYGDYTDRWGDLLTWMGYAEDEADALRQLKQDAGNFSRGYAIDPNWTLALEDGRKPVPRAEYERLTAAGTHLPPSGRDEHPAAARIAAE